MTGTEFSSLSAQFNSGSFLVTEHDPKLPPCSEHTNLIQYLNPLVQRGWRVNLATFKNLALILDLERSHQGSQVTPQYLIQTNQLSLCDAAQIVNPKMLFEGLKKPMVQGGWKELESSILFTGHETWMIALWVKDWPKYVYPLRP